MTTKGTTCSCTYADDSAVRWCGLPVGHDGPHEATVRWSDAECASWQHNVWNDGYIHTREGHRE